MQGSSFASWDWWSSCCDVCPERNWWGWTSEPLWRFPCFPFHYPPSFPLISVSSLSVFLFSLPPPVIVFRLDEVPQNGSLGVLFNFLKREGEKLTPFSVIWFQDRDYFIYSECWVLWQDKLCTHTLCHLTVKSSRLKQLCLVSKVVKKMGVENITRQINHGLIPKEERGVCVGACSEVVFTGMLQKSMRFSPANANFAELNFCLGHLHLTL